METNYSKHAAVWDWDDYDRSMEFEFWYNMSKKYGKNVLSAMGAIGQLGAYMVNRGSCVTVLDYTKEMIFEGIERFGDIKDLEFIQADISKFDLKRKNYDFCTITSTDLHLLPSLEMVELALCNVNKHLRVGGGLGLELLFPYNTYHDSPMKRFDPRVPKTNGILIWKEGKSTYDTITKKHDIHQIIYVKSGDVTKSFEHNISLQLYDKNILFNVIDSCGFEIVGKYHDYGFNTDNDYKENHFFELKKIATIEI